MASPTEATPLARTGAAVGGRHPPSDWDGPEHFDAGVQSGM